MFFDWEPVCIPPSPSLSQHFVVGGSAVALSLLASCCRRLGRAPASPSLSCRLLPFPIISSWERNRRGSASFNLYCWGQAIVPSLLAFYCRRLGRILACPCNSTSISLHWGWNLCHRRLSLAIPSSHWPCLALPRSLWVPLASPVALHASPGVAWLFMLSP